MAAVALTIADSPSIYSRLGVFFIWVAILFVVAGFLGALLEVVFGTRLLVRCAFGLLFLVFFGIVALAPPPEQPQHALVSVAAAVSGMALFFGGLTASILRWKDERALWPRMLAARQDLAQGEVLVFRGRYDAETSVPDDLSWIAFEPGSEREQTLGVLPTSRLLVSIDGSASPCWMPVETTSAAPPPETSDEESVGEAARLAVDEATVTQRALSSSEIDDLRRQVRRGLPGEIGRAVAYAWCCGLLGGGMWRLVSGRGGATLDVAGLSIAAVVGAILLARIVVARLRLRGAIGAGHVLVMRPRTPTTDAPRVVEMLPGSRIAWTIDGRPAPWRRTAG